jgi:OmpA-OmpF porin, OOP family
MRSFITTSCIVAGFLLTSGCATKKFVRNTTTPIQAKVDQVGTQTTQNTKQLQETNTQLAQVDERAKSGISAAQERATAADQHAAEALSRANQAAQTAGQAVTASEQNTQGLSTLRQAVVNIDDYRVGGNATVQFKTGSAVLSEQGKQDLDRLAADALKNKRYFLAVEGYTDSTGSRTANEALSRRRAEAVVEYLVAKQNIPVYRIHTIGLGQERPIEEGKTRAARAKNRRVEVKLYSADQVTAGLAR